MRAGWLMNHRQQAFVPRRTGAAQLGQTPHLLTMQFICLILSLQIFELLYAANCSTLKHLQFSLVTCVKQIIQVFLSQLTWNDAIFKQVVKNTLFLPPLRTANYVRLYQTDMLLILSYKISL